MKKVTKETEGVIIYKYTTNNGNIRFNITIPADRGWQFLF